MFIDPAMAILHNVKTNTFHPIVFEIAPFPGPDSPGKPQRWKSKGHHPTGFPTHQEAKDNINTEVVPKLPYVKLDIERTIPWDGEDIPVMSLLGMVHENGKFEFVI